MRRDHLRRCTAIFAIASACHPAPPATNTSGTTVPDVAPPSTPEFLQLEIDPAVAHPQQVRIVRAGELRLEHDGAAVNEPENRNASIVARLLDIDDYGTPSRPRLLCEGPQHRVAVYVERDDLAWVAARTVSLYATPPSGSPAPARDDQPGVRLQSGTAVRVEGNTDGDVVRVRYERPGVKVAGFVRREDVGIAFVPEPAVSRAHFGDARLVAPAQFSAAPSGFAIGEVDPRLAIGLVALHMIGTEQNKQILVRVGNDELQLVGWVTTSAIERGAASGPSSTVRGPGFDAVEGKTVKLKRGTLLRGGGLRHALGVVTTDGELACTADCDTPHPRVAVAACTAMVELVVD